MIVVVAEILDLEDKSSSVTYFSDASTVMIVYLYLSTNLLFPLQYRPCCIRRHAELFRKHVLFILQDRPYHDTEDQV